MARFLDLPPEIRQLIYDELLVDPVNNESRLVCAWDASGNTTWSRGAEPLDTYVEPTVDNLPALIESSISHIDYNDLWSLATANKLLYLEATPTMYMHAQLEIFFGSTPTLLHTYLEKITPVTCALHQSLTISYGRKGLSTNDMSVLMDLVNPTLPNLHSLNIRAIHPSIEAWPKVQRSSLLRDLVSTMVALRPVARLTSLPVILVSPRARLFSELDLFKDRRHSGSWCSINWSKTLDITRPLKWIRRWRGKSQDYHTRASERGDYLLLTSSLRSTFSGATDAETAEELSDMEEELADHERVLWKIEKYNAFKSRQARSLRVLRR